MTKAEELAIQIKWLASEYGAACAGPNADRAARQAALKAMDLLIDELAALAESNSFNLSDDQIRESGEKAALDRQRGYTVGENEPDRYSVLVDLAIFDAMTGRSER